MSPDETRGGAHLVRKLHRRTFLNGCAVAGAGLFTGLLRPLAAGAAKTADVPSSSAVSAWSDPATWGGSVPGPNDVAMITKPVMLDVDARVAGVDIRPSGLLAWAPDKSVTLESKGNVLVAGRLEMKPGSRSKQHKLVFVEVDESRFVGGGMDVLPSDVGLWVMGEGVLDVLGAYGRAWTRLAGGVDAGDTTLTLSAGPKGWKVGDEISITPTRRPEDRDNHTEFDTATIAKISGPTITLSRPLEFAHPQVVMGRGRTMTAEVLNLTRNVIIQGTPSGRSHIFIRSSKPQSVRNALIRHMGPRRSDEEFVLGRYGLHLHHCTDGSRGSVVKGVVIRDCSSHSFVPHMSHGIKFRNCIAYDCVEDAYWWDDAEVSNDILWSKCVAALVKVGSSKYTLGGFVFGRGTGNVCRKSVAAGIQGLSGSSGFNWTNSKSEGVWLFEDCVGHNNKSNGIFVWQNTEKIHVISRFVGYHNGGAGISHGAYRNAYKYNDIILFGNSFAAIKLSAQSKKNSPVRFTNVLCDADRLSEFCVETTKHIQPPDNPVEFVGCEFKGADKAAIGVSPGSNNSDEINVVDCTFAANELWLDDEVNVDTIVRIQDPERGALALRRADQTGYGEYRSEWNARVESIAPFSARS